MSNWNARRKDEAKIILEVMMAENFSKVMIVQHLHLYIERGMSSYNCGELQRTKDKK